MKDVCIVRIESEMDDAKKRTSNAYEVHFTISVHEDFTR
jgi:hypothetical protein